MKLISDMEMFEINRDMPSGAKYGDVFKAVASTQLAADEKELKELKAELETRFDNSDAINSLAWGKIWDKYLHQEAKS